MAFVLEAQIGVIRKFLIWVKRTIIHQNSQILASHSDGNQLVWNDANVDYVSGLAIAFQLNISSLPYLDPQYDKTYYTNSEIYIKHYFEKLAQKQFGTHVFVSIRGDVCTVNTGFVDTFNRTEYKCTNKAAICAVYPVPHLEKIDGDDQLVLTLGFWFKKYKEMYEKTSYRVGRPRYYYRFAQEKRYQNDPVTCGGVAELTEQLLQEVYDNREVGTNSNLNTKFALYVCAGAKLIVIDQYHWNQVRKDEIAHHNRSLVQQGGIVVVEREIKFKTIDYSNKLVKYRLKKAINRGVISGHNEQIVKDFKNPVIFLGANPSDHNSIAWSLNIPREESGFAVKCNLVIPEGGYIVAIEEWSDGIEEIMCRHRFEQLFRSNISLNNNFIQLGYMAPNSRSMLNKILGLGADRSLNCDIRQFFPPRLVSKCEYMANSELKPLEFNFSHPSVIEEAQVEEAQVEEAQVEEAQVEEAQVEEAQVEEAQVEEAQVEEAQVEEAQVDEGIEQYDEVVDEIVGEEELAKVVNTIPALYPPIVLNGELFYLPNNGVKVDGYQLKFEPMDAFERHYKPNRDYRLEGKKLVVFGQYEEKKYDFIFDISPDWHYYQEYKWVKRPLFLATGHTLDCTGLSTRYGVDGHLYRKRNKIIGPFQTRYYELVGKLEYPSSALQLQSIGSTHSRSGAPSATQSGPSTSSQSQSAQQYRRTSRSPSDSRQSKRRKPSD